MKNKAFTLIELLVVIVIIGILATISTATFSGSSQKARDSKRLIVAKELDRNIRTFMTEDQSNDFHNIFPDVEDIPQETGSLFLQKLEANDFQNQNFPNGCIWIGKHSTDRSLYVIAYAEESQVDTMRVIGNPNSSISIPYTDSCFSGIPPVLTDYSFTVFALLSSPMELMNYSGGTYCVGSSEGSYCYAF